MYLHGGIHSTEHEFKNGSDAAVIAMRKRRDGVKCSYYLTVGQAFMRLTPNGQIFPHNSTKEVLYGQLYTRPGTWVGGDR